jgi:hypothetical protein
MQRKDGFVVRIKIKDETGKVVGETDAIAFKGLLSLAHEEGLRSVRTKLIQIPSEENGRTAIAISKVRTSRGRFTGIGDANPGNVNRRIAPHVIRMAETRATARALRLAVNIGEVAIEELSDDYAIDERPAPGTRDGHNGRSRIEDGPRPTNGAPIAASNAAGNGPSGSASDGSGPPRRFRGRDTRPTEAEPGDRRAMSEEQKKLLFRLAFENGSRDTARDRVLKALGVERLEWATRADASRAIDALKREGASRTNEREANGQGPNGEARHDS